LKSTSVNDLWLSGQLVFLAGGDGLRIVDVSTPAVPVCRSSYTNGYVNSVTVVGRYAYLLGDGLHVLDISDPAQPREVGMLAGVWGSCIIVRGTSAYVTSSGNSLQVIDVTDPAQPRLVGALATNRNMSRVDVAGQYAYVTVPPYWDYINGNSVRYAGYLAVIDISDSAHPRLTFTLTVDGDACDVVVSGQQAYLADGGAGLKVVDIRLPNSPMIIASATSIQPAQSVCVSGPAAYVATYDAGLQVMDISNAYSPRLMGTVTTTGFAQSVVVSGRYAYLADGVRGLQVLDITDPQQPTLSGGCRDVWPTSVTVAGQRLFLVPFQVLDITDPTRPQALGAIDDNSCVNVALDRDVAYLTGYPGLRTVDVSQPAVPTVLGGFALSGGGHGIGFRDHYACVGCDWSGLQIFDIASPAEPRRVGTYYPDGSVMDVVVRSNTAYATLTEDPGLEVIDVTDPQRPTRISSLPLPVATNVAITAGNYACVTGDGLEVIDLGDPAHPVLVGRHQLGTATYGLQVAGDLAYVAAGEYGLAIYRLTPELKLQALTRVAGGLNLSWLGGPGIRLQRATSLSNPDWQDVPNSDGANSIRLPPSGAAGFYRLVRK
jgi:hypothetical protein